MVIPRAVFYVVLCAGLAVLHVRLIPYAFDDAYIHVRIAQHLLSHGEPYFNLGEPVMASSSPVWTLVLAALFAPGTPPMMSIAVINSVVTALCVRVYADLLRTIADGVVPWLWGDLVVAALLVPILAPASLGLMETPLAVLLTGIGLLLLQNRRPLAFTAFALAAFVRLEFGTVLVIFAAAALRTRRFRLREVLLYTSIGALPLAAYDLYFFRTLVPHSVYAKSRGYDLTFGEVAFTIPGWPFPNPAYRMALFVTAVAIAWDCVARRSVPWMARIAFLGGVAIVATYVATRALVFSWYVPLFLTLITWPLLAALTSASPKRTRPLMYRAICLGVVLTLAGPSVGSFVRFVRGALVNPAYAPSFGEGARVQSYMAAGRRLAAEFPRSRVMTSEIGGLGFAFSGAIDDGFGLVSPAALKHHPLRVPEDRRSGGLGAIPPGYIAEVNPPLILSYDIFVEAFLRSPLQERYIRSELPIWTDRDVAYARAAGIPTEFWGIRSLTLFVRRDIHDQAASSTPDGPGRRAR